MKETHAPVEVITGQMDDIFEYGCSRNQWKIMVK